MTRSPAWYRALARLPIKNVFSARSAQVHRNDTAGPPVEEKSKRRGLLMLNQLDER